MWSALPRQTSTGCGTRAKSASVIASPSPSRVIISAVSRMTVFKSEDIKNSKGEVVYSEEKEVGSLEVFDVQPDRSKAKLVTGVAKEGMTIKVQ